MDKKQNAKSVEPRLSKLEEYLYANLMVWGFLIIVAGISFFTCGAVWDDVTFGVMKFLFLIIGGGMALVSVLDYFYDQTMSEPTGEKQG